MNLVKLSSTSYPNVKFDNDATKDDSVNSALLDDLQKAAQAAGLVITITTAKSGHDKYTKSNNVSRHYAGAAVDIAIIDGIGSGKATNSSNGNPEFREKGTKLANALKQLGYDCCSREKGNEKAVLWQTNTGGNHFNHLHVSNKSGMSSDLNIIDIEDELDIESKLHSIFDTDDEPKFNIWKAFSDSLIDIGKEKLKDIKEDVNRFDEILKYDKKLSEDIDLSKMIRGSKEYKSGNKSTLRGFGGDYIYSPIDGTIEHIDSSICNGLLIIKKKGLEDEYIEICGVKEPFVYQGQRVYLGDKLGTSKEKNLNVEISKKKKIKSYPDKKVKSYKSKSSYSPIITKNEFEKLPYTLQAMPMKLSLDLGKTILGIKEEINQIKKLLK